MIDRRFILLRGTPTGPAFLARPDHHGDADTWTGQRDDARLFPSWDDAALVRDEVVATMGIAVAVVPAKG